MKSEAWEMGHQHQQSSDPEPVCPFAPGSQKYSEYADGFCADIEPWSDDHETSSDT